MISDIVLLKELPETIKRSKQAYIACIYGAVMKDEYIKLIKDAVFQVVKIIEETSFLINFIIDDLTGKAVLKDLNLSSESIKELASSAASVNVYGIKPK